MIANSLLVISMFYLLLGSLGINKLRGVLPKLLTSSMIDTASLILLVMALVMKLGFSNMSMKLLITLLFILLTNPVINHFITRAAYNDLKSRDEV